MSPSLGVLKLNFDGSAVQSIGREGIIQDWNGNIVRNYSGFVDSFDANEFEVFALLVGCREGWKISMLLLRMILFR